SWFAAAEPDVVYVLMEVRQETDYVRHHAQKILAIFAAMRAFAEALRAAGHRVQYLRISDPSNTQSIPDNLEALAALHAATAIEYQTPDEWRLFQQLERFAAAAGRPVRRVDSEHFMTERDEAARLFGNRSHWLLEKFYRYMRVRHRVLVDAEDRPLGGRWNFDASNRNAWRGEPPEPPDSRIEHDHRELWNEIVDAGVESFGEPHANALRWPVDRGEALRQLDVFIEHGLPSFGRFQDAMSGKAERLFHSLLSFALNTKMLHPREVIDRAEAAFRARHAPLASVEGFIRQILGWREYVRGVYWARMPAYAESNVLGQTLPLPSWFWTGRVRAKCLAHSIGQSLDGAHAHHIQRLMVIGNFALLAGLDPGEVHRWYLGVYIDAFEWVEMPNTLGLSQYADGGLLATKPYVSSAAYIHRMSDYCKTCPYSRTRRTGADACPFNALYWDFFQRNRARLAGNHRLARVYHQFDRMGRDEHRAIATAAAAIRQNLEAV
ncbi:MAG TPA: cryptochrome/photolyase family protein, partial [Rhodanobacteraceae bacterium]